MRINRISREDIILDHALVSIGLAVQPDVIRCANEPKFRGRGLLSRFLFSVPKSNVGRRKINPNPIDEELMDFYRELILSLLAKSDESPSLRMTDEARTVLNQFREKVEFQMRTGEKLAHLQDVGTKLPGNVARISGLLAIWSGNSGLIEEETMTNAVRIGEYYLEYAMGAFQLMGRDRVKMDAIAALSWLQEQGRKLYTVREVHHALKNRFEKKDYLMKAMSIFGGSWIYPDTRKGS